MTKNLVFRAAILLGIFSSAFGAGLDTARIDELTGHVFYDSKRHRIYAICGAGKIDIIEQTDPKTYNALTKLDTKSGACTGLFVPERDTLFVAVPNRGSQQTEIRSY